MKLAHGVLAVIESGSTQVGTLKNKNKIKKRKRQ